MNRYAPQIQRAIREQMISDELYSTGKTARSVFAKVGETADSIGVFIDRSSAFSGSSAFVFDVLQFGRKAGKRQPPYSPIVRWMKQKNIAAFPGMNTKQTAFLIARSIGKKGTIKRFGYQGRNISELAMLRIVRAILSDSSEAYIKDVEQHIKNSSSKNVN
jgi:hypothetical protein